MRSETWFKSHGVRIQRIKSGLAARISLNRNAMLRGAPPHSNQNRSGVSREFSPRVSEGVQPSSSGHPLPIQKQQPTQFGLHLFVAQLLHRVNHNRFGSSLHSLDLRLLYINLAPACHRNLTFKDLLLGNPLALWKTHSCTPKRKEGRFVFQNI